jgi:hypothetical protein
MAQAYQGADPGVPEQRARDIAIEAPSAALPIAHG